MAAVTDVVPLFLSQHAFFGAPCTRVDRYRALQPRSAERGWQRLGCARRAVQEVHGICSQFNVARFQLSQRLQHRDSR